MENSETVRGGTVQRLEAALLDDISSGVLVPGERLDEVQMAKRFGVSRTPVREAFSRLTAQGILIAGVKRGVRVAEYSREELAQVFEAMHEIEVACARIVSQRVSLLSRAEIESAQKTCVIASNSNNLSGFLRANEDFHQAIYRATGNPYMAQIASDFRRRTGPFRAKKFGNHEDLLAAARSHDVLLAHIFSENSVEASSGMRAHMTESFMQTLAAN